MTWLLFARHMQAYPKLAFSPADKA